MAGKKMERKGMGQPPRIGDAKRKMMVMVMPRVKEEVRICWRGAVEEIRDRCTGCRGFARGGSAGRGGSYSGSSELARGGSAFRAGIWRGVSR
jgi:hypothetical protein